VYRVRTIADAIPLLPGLLGEVETGGRYAI
jgi:hypothetical protein